jgi:hypothetical protein
MRVLIDGKPTEADSPDHRLDESPAGYSSAGWSPPVVYQTVRLDKQARNSVRAGERLGYSGSAPRPQPRPRAQWCPTSPTTSVVPGPVLNTVMTESLQPKRG